MKGSDRFRADAAARIRALLTERGQAGRDEQKRLRRELRAIGFHISDWETGLTAADFDALVIRGRITVDGRPSGPMVPGGPRRPTTMVEGRRRRGLSSDDVPAVADGGHVPESVLDAAIAALTSPRLSIPDATTQAPRVGGLYAVYGTEQAWAQLQLDGGDGRPLYVGKSEHDLATRDIKMHFASGRTGQSTLRRSLAALLRDELRLMAQPRNPASPERFSHYALNPDGEEALTTWMREHLELALWTPAEDVALASVERAVLHR